MNVGESVRLAIDDGNAGKLDSAMLHACNAVDGTAGKLFPGKGVGKRFKRLLRDNFDILGPMGMPGIDLMATRFPVQVLKPDAPRGGVDIADIIYGIHRCCHAHGDELPQGFELVPDALRGQGATSMIAMRGKLAISDRMIYALLGIAVFNPINIGQIVPPGYSLLIGSLHHFDIGRWWGQRDLVSKICTIESPSTLRIDFNEWNENN